MRALEFEALARPLSRSEREAVRESLAGLLRFHRSLARWPALRAPRATPIVAVYEAGVLRGCALHRGDEPGRERLARAFLAATATIEPSAQLAAQVFFPRTMRWLDDPATLEVGTEGVALVRPGAMPVLLMPQVARDHGVDARGLLALLATKAGAAFDLAAELPDGARLAAWTVDSVVARANVVETASARAAASTGASAADYAAAWLARMVDARGRVAFALDPRTRTLQPTGPLWHARSAIAIASLAAHGGHARVVARARRWLGNDVARALRGNRVEAWPEDRASVAGTVALACLAGIPAHDRLRALVADLDALARSPAWPWHAGQVACALARDTPPALWAWCKADLSRRPFAPYVALAAQAIGDEPGYRRAAAAVAPFVRRTPPHRGATAATALAETGVTAVAAHALAASRSSGAHRAAHADALAFVRARQLLPDRIPAALDPALALGGFAGTPVDDVLRSDIAGHALLALL